MAGRLAHVNVVRIYDILREDGHESSARSALA
jgi:hypothetical protein